MNWRDLLYFSKGERRALTLLLCLVTISWILLLWTDTKRMPIESQTDAHRTENQQASGERRIITGKTHPKRKPVPSGRNPDLIRIKLKTPLLIKIAILIDNAPYSTSKKRKGYTPYTQTEKYAPGTLVELNTADTTILKKSPRHRQHFRPENHKIQGTLRRLLRCQPVGGSVRDRRGTPPSPRPLVHCRHAPYTQVRGQRIVCRHPPQTPLPRLPTSKSDRTAPETKKQALRVGEPAIDRRIYRYGQETAHTIPVI